MTLFERRQRVLNSINTRDAKLAARGLRDIADDALTFRLGDGYKWNRNLFSEAVVKAPRIGRAKEDRLFVTVAEGIAAQEKIAENDNTDPDLQEKTTAGKEAGLLIALDYTRLPWRFAHQVWKQHAGNPKVQIEDLRQAGYLGLMQAIDTYAKIPEEERRAFAGYAAKTIYMYARRQAHDDFLGKNVAKDGSEESLQLQRFLDSRKRLRTKHGEVDPHPSEIAHDMGVSTELVCSIQQLADPIILVSPLSEFDNSRAELMTDHQIGRSSSDGVRKAIMIERALEFLKPEHARVMQLRFGIQDGRSLTTSEIAKETGMNVDYVSTITHQSYPRLTGMITQYLNNTVDYDDLRSKRDIRNVFGLFHCLGYQPPDEARLSDLKLLAQELLEKNGIDERDKQIIIRLYGLDQDASKPSSKEVAAEFGMSAGGIRAVDNRVRKKLTEAQDKDQ